MNFGNCFRAVLCRVRIQVMLILVVAPPLSAIADDDINPWIEQQTSRSKALLAANISPTFAARGAVVAAPSFTYPQYFSYWVRDGALTMNVIVSLWAESQPGADRNRYAQMLDDYRKFSRQNQRTTNPSGAADKAGLGEPRFNADGTVYNKWGRPQNDGPALRALTLIRWANLLLDQGQTNLVRQNLYDALHPDQTQSVIKLDLEFVARVILDPCYDLWEERFGLHFYTRMVQREALLEGAKLADRLNDGGAAAYYRQRSQVIQVELDKHRDRTTHGVAPTFGDGRVFDAAVVLAVLHTDNSDDEYFSARDEFVLGSLNLILAGFDPTTAANADHFPINDVQFDRSGARMGLTIGRYSTDTYDGDDARVRSDDGSKAIGNGWVLCTLAVGELGYRAASRFDKAARIDVTGENLGLIRRLDPTLANVQPNASWMSNQAEFKAVTGGLRRLGEAQLRRIRFHSNPDGSLSEQINRRTGFMWGAPNLTWSHAAFLTTASR